MGWAGGGAPGQVARGWQDSCHERTRRLSSGLDLVAASKVAQPLRRKKGGGGWGEVKIVRGEGEKRNGVDVVEEDDRDKRRKR